MYSIIDIEATGGNAKIGRVTEVAIYRFDGERIVDEFSSLINPERKIDPYVQRLTGITDAMARKAPKFHEVAKSIVEITQGSCFVGHNVRFDYSFLQAEFASLGYPFKMSRLCTLELSKKLIPGIPSYGLKKLCKSLEIPLDSHHRASSDAKATVALFQRLLEIDKEKVEKHLRKA
ncbi:MAG: 3'-5' exonuclease [Vicingaceae bacterium]